MKDCEQCKMRYGCKPGNWSMHCIECCAELVLTTRPCKRKAAAMLEAIGRHKKSPAREKIIQRVSEKMEIKK